MTTIVAFNMPEICEWELARFCYKILHNLLQNISIKIFSFAKLEALN